MTIAPANSHGNGYPLGLTGATAPTRYVGGTTSGAPASGTFAVGDFVIDQTAKVYVCTVAGSPGTWVQAGGTGGISSGTSFPVSPSNNDLFYRTDLDLIFFYDGTRWLTTQLFRVPIYSATATIATNSTLPWVAPDLGTGLDMWLVAWEVTSFVVTTNTGAAFWTLGLSKMTAANAETSLASRATSADSPDVWVAAGVAIGAALGGTATYKALVGKATKTGAPGALAYGSSLSYRLIGT